MRFVDQRLVACLIVAFNNSEYATAPFVFGADYLIGGAQKILAVIAESSRLVHGIRLTLRSAEQPACDEHGRLVK